jgi:hypothetical protein
MRDPSIVNDQIQAIRWSFSKFCKILVVDLLGQLNDLSFPGSFFQSWASNMLGAYNVFLSQDLIYDPALAPIGKGGVGEIQDKTILVKSIKNNSCFLEEEARAFFKNKRQSTKKMVAL